MTELDLQVAQVPKSSIEFFKCVYLCPPTTLSCSRADLTFASFRRSAAVSTELEIPGDLKADERETVAYDCESLATCFRALRIVTDCAPFLLQLT